MEEARARLEKAETELDDLEASQGKHELDTDDEMALLEKIKLKHEQLEAERKVFEDLEFHKMEEEAQLEAEMEEVSMLMSTTQKELDTAETVVSEMELQKAEITINQDVSILQVQNIMEQNRHQPGCVQIAGSKGILTIRVLSLCYG